MRLTPKGRDWKAGCHTRRLVAGQRGANMTSTGASLPSRPAPRWGESVQQRGNISGLWKISHQSRPPSPNRPYGQYYTLCTDISLVNTLLSHRAEAGESSFHLWLKTVHTNTARLEKMYAWAPKHMISTDRTHTHTCTDRSHGNWCIAVCVCVCVAVPPSFQWNSSKTRSSAHVHVLIWFRLT